MGQKPIDEKLGQGIYNYEETFLMRTIDTITTVAASLFPLLSIVLLFLVQSEVIRLGIVVLFSGLFSLALCLMTSARKVEVFAATAAYDFFLEEKMMSKADLGQIDRFAAVNVVFLTNDSPKSSAVCAC